MVSNSKDIFATYKARGLADRDAMFATFDHLMELCWKNDQQLRGEIDQLKKREGQ